MRKKKHLYVILSEMCKYVNADIDTLNFNKEGWFLQYAWDPQDEQRFKKWMVRYLQKNRGARFELMAYPQFATTDYIMRFVDAFVLQYGWQYAPSDLKTNHE